LRPELQQHFCGLNRIGRIQTRNNTKRFDVEFLTLR
jgi:hypothetical protein